MKVYDKFPKTVMGFYWSIVKHFPYYYGIIFLCGILINGLGMLIGPLTQKWMVQIFESASTMTLTDVLLVLSWLGVLYCSGPVLNFIKSYVHGARQQIFNRYKLFVLYSRVYDNDIPFFIDMPGGQISGYIREISGDMDILMQKFWVEIIGTLLGFGAIVFSMTIINYWFVVMLLGFAVVKVVWEVFIQKKLNKNNKEQTIEDSKVYGVRQDSINNALIVKYFANQDQENKYMYDARNKMIKLVRRGAFLARCQWFPTSIGWRLMLMAILVMCFFMIKDNTITIANAVYIVSAASSLNMAVNRISEQFYKYSVTMARVKTAFEKIIIERKITDKPNAKKLKKVRGYIKFDNVDFSYGKNQVLKNFNLEIKPKEKVGIVGLSGAGKTTLCNLLLRMYDVDKGAVRVDGTDIRDLTQESLLKNISFVPQDTTLFNRTIFENIRFADNKADKNRVISVAKKANIHDFIDKLPMKYKTLVGNNGIKLSGGQRQRVSIARALLKDAPILVLDEATSALDSKNEIMIQKSLQIAMQGKTTLVIAHRLSTLRNMDRIVVIRNGKIIESGTHKQLLRKNGAYRALWNMQTSGFVS